MEPDDDLDPNLPRKAYLPGVGRVDVFAYKGNGYFWVLDNKDAERLVKRKRLIFIASRGPSPS